MLLRLAVDSLYSDFLLLHQEEQRLSDERVAFNSTKNDEQQFILLLSNNLWLLSYIFYFQS